MVKFKAVILALAFLAVLFASLSLTPWKTAGEVQKSLAGEVQQSIYGQRTGERFPESGIANIGMQIFTTYVFPFEILALVLTAALVGAVYVARREAA